MAGTFKISAIPVLHSQGAFKGKLKGVSFMAVSPANTVEWFANNCGQFELEFSKLMPRSLAHIFVAALMHGDDVELPGWYDKKYFEHGFLFQWTTIQPAEPSYYAQEYAV
jgi:hypothetical protein